MSEDKDRKKRLDELLKAKREREEKAKKVLQNIDETVKTTKEEEKVEQTKNDVSQLSKQNEDSSKKRSGLKFETSLGLFHYAPSVIKEKYDKQIQAELGTNADNLPQSAKKGPLNEEDVVELPKPKPEERRVSILQRPQLPHHEHQATHDLSQDELKNILKSKTFKSFFDKTSKIVEKVNFLDKFYLQALSDGNVEVYENIFENEAPGYIDQSFDATSSDSQGVVLLWSSTLKSRPEFSFFCQTSVTTAKFNPFSTSVIVGGTYSGQLILWDVRTKSIPVQKSGMASGHAHPIFSLAIVGTQNSHNIVTLSNDGKLCVWNPSMLNTPEKTFDLKLKNKEDSLNATAICFSESEANHFYVGSEEGIIYSAQVHAKISPNLNDSILETYSGHQAPVTAISMMPHHSGLSSDVSNLMLSSSYDWSVKLWNPRIRTEPIYSFESAEDYIFDVSWHKTNPALFVSVDGDGYIDLWDLSRDLEVPLLHYKADTMAINKAMWSRDGSKLLVGNSGGTVKLFGLHKQMMKTGNEENLQYNIENLLRAERKD